MALVRWCHAGQASSPARLTLAWPGITCPHPVECTGQPGFTASAHPDVSSVVPVVRRAVATVGLGQASGLRGRGTGGSPRRITRYGPAGGLQVGAGCAGWSGIYVLTSVWCGLVGVWWLSGSAALTRCGGAVVTPFTGGAWPVQVGSPKFFGQGGGWAVSRAYTYQTTHSCVGHNR